MKRGFDSLFLVVEEEKRIMTISIQIFMTGRCHARYFSRASRKGKNGPQLAPGVLGKSNTRLLRGSILGNVPTRVEAFPTLLLSAQHFLKPWSGYPCLRCTK